MDKAGVKTISSKDGTTIAYDQVGQGPALILVASALSTRQDLSALAGLLAEHFTVINYDRRGRGESSPASLAAATDELVHREVEDIEALIDAAGGSAFLFGHSSGAVLALEAASRLPGKVKKAFLFEPPFVVDDSRPPVPTDFATQITHLVAGGKRSEAVEYFMTQVVGVPAEFVEQMKVPPMWSAMEETVHTLPFDSAVMGNTQQGKPLDAKRWSSVRAHVMVMAGGESPDWLHNGAQALAAVLPAAQYRTLDGQDHSVAVMAPDVLARVLVEFLAQP